MNKTPTISIAMATFNEEANIKRCLDAIHSWVDEIVIVDGESTDNTVMIAKKYSKVKIISTSNKPIFHINKQIAIDACKSNWILQLDADEVVTLELKDEILKTIINTKFDGFWINRKNYFLGHFLTKGGAYPDPTLRLYRLGLGHLPCKDVHEQAVVSGQVGHLQHDLQHFSDASFFRYYARSNRYTSIEAKLLADQGKKLSFFDYFFIKPIFRFCQIFFRHLGFHDGFPGFIYAFYSSLRYPAVYVKHYELTVLKGNLNDYQ